MAQQPWASGPGEILQHGLSLLRKDNDVNRRLAMISIDNAVELMMKTYLGLPKRVSGISMSRREFNDISESFPGLLDALERHAMDRLTGINLGEIEWYHRLRNQLYHQGNGLTVERDKVDVYAELARLLFKNLFGEDLPVRQTEEVNALGLFMEAWVKLEQTIINWVQTDDAAAISLILAVRFLRNEKIIGKDLADEIEELNQFRNEIVHGKKDHRNNHLPEMIERVKSVVDKLELALSRASK